MKSYTENSSQILLGIAFKLVANFLIQYIMFNVYQAKSIDTRSSLHFFLC